MHRKLPVFHVLTSLKLKLHNILFDETQVLIQEQVIILVFKHIRKLSFVR